MSTFRIVTIRCFCSRRPQTGATAPNQRTSSQVPYELPNTASADGAFNSDISKFMGRITVFIKPDCKYCDKLKSILIQSIRTHVIPAQEASKKAQADRASNAASGMTSEPEAAAGTEIEKPTAFYGI